MQSNFYEAGLKLYSGFLKEQPVIQVPNEYVNIAESVIRKLGWQTQVMGLSCDYRVNKVDKNKKVMIALSGGLDSVYFMHKLIDTGFEVTAVHVAGLNKSSAAVEAEQAAKIAAGAGAKFIKANFKAPQQVFPTTPSKISLFCRLCWT